VVSSARPASPVIAVAHDEAVCRRLALHWGIVPIQGGEGDLENPGAFGRRLAQDLGLARTGDSILMVRGFHPDPALSAPSVTVLTV
jgi:pyruvate kinase